MNILKKVGLGLTAAAALLSANLTKANPHFFLVLNSCHNQHEMHYSPYALSYMNSGLVSGTTTYSPYALSYQNPGLINENASYSPYALSYSNPGLISEYAGHSSKTYGYLLVTNQQQNQRSGQNQPLWPTDINFRKAVAKENAEKIKKRMENDGMWIICEYLKDKKIEGFGIDRIFRAEEDLVSVNFVSLEKRIAIKYWNPKKIEYLEGSAAKCYEKYKEDWEKLSKDYMQQGYKIHEIKSSDKKETLSKLEEILK